MAVGRHRRREVAAAAAHLSRARMTPASRRRLETLHTGWRLHAWLVEAGRQVASVRAAAGAVETQRWRSVSARGRNGAIGTAPMHTRASLRSGGLSQFMPAWPWASFEIELGRTEQWANSVRCTVLFQLFKNYSNLLILVCCLPDHRCPKFVSS
jgi:hypothetical protein